MSFFDGQTWSGVVQFNETATISAFTTWDPFGSGHPRLIVAGDNLQIAGVGHTHLLSFDGTTWSSLAELTPSASGGGLGVKALTIWDPDGAGGVPDALVIGGNFTQLNGK